MATQDDHGKRMIDKFERLYENTQGGIFTKKTRQRILTKEGISGKGRTKNQFWYRQRENVKTALIDLRLFLEHAGIDNVGLVVTEEALRPIVHALLYRPTVHESPADRERAEIAQMCIEFGFDYLRAMKSNHMTLSHRRTIEEALDLTSYLVAQFKGES